MKVLISFIVFYVSVSLYFFSSEVAYSLSDDKQDKITSITNDNSAMEIPQELTHFEDFTALSCEEDEDKEDEEEIKTLPKKPIKMEEQLVDIDEQFKEFAIISIPDLTIKTDKSDFWQILYMIESRQGASLFRPKNRGKSCLNTSAPCGHHQLNAQALKDIGCKSRQCKKDREDYDKSLAMTKKLQAINKKRMKKFGYKDLPEYQEYLIHQQGAKGTSIILAASEGKKLLSKSIKNNMANNSPYSYKQLRKMGSKLAAKQFMKYWQKQWNKKKVMVTQHARNKSMELPELSPHDLQIALNITIPDY